jgi:hypothetical protein
MQVMKKLSAFFCIWLFLSLIFSTRVAGQLTVVQGAAMAMTPEQLVQNYLIGAGVTISNVTYNGSSALITSDQVGTFSTAGIATQQLGLTGGILLTSGKANIAIGPNSQPGAGAQIGGPGDPDLNTLSGSNTFDRALLEFDFIPQFDTIRFRYVFGSEEFFEYCNQYNDAFGFFLSGPGISGTFSNNSVNIARMPGAINNYVTINNICANTASRWTNSGGQYYQYDGLTYVFTAWYVVQPCTTYHIKLAIGDAVDKAFDSGVFLEENSFSSPGVNMVNSNTIPALSNKAVESCNDVTVNFRLSATLNYSYRVNYTISGDAINGIDYTHINDYVIFPPGEDSVNVIIHPIPDNNPEGPERVIFTLNQVGCDGVIKRDTVVIDDYQAMTLQPLSDTALCFGGTINLAANISGGIAPFFYQWNVPGGDSTLIFTPPVGNNVVIINVTDVCSRSVHDTSLIQVHPVPVANAGSNATIPNGTSTTLHGSASGGYGSYSYSWTSNPPGFTSSLPEPSTGNMSNTLIYILRVTDLLSGCTSEPSQVIVVVEGGPLSVNPVAEPNAVCLGDSVQLFALAGGGSGLYSYQWTSTPQGFSSGSMNPWVVPSQSTTYQVIVNDGFNQRTGTTQVQVYPLPVIQLGSKDTLVCIYDSVILDAGNPGSTYLWSNGATTRKITVATTGIGYDAQKYKVTVINENQCISSDSIIVEFSVDACVGVEELSYGRDFRIFPNPANSFCKVTMKPGLTMNNVSMSDITGRKISETDLSSVSPQSFILDIQGIAAGLYFIKIVSDKGTGVARLIVRRE